MGEKIEHLCTICKAGPKCFNMIAHAGKNWDTNFEHEDSVL